MSILYDFIINKEGDTFSANYLLNPEAEGIAPDVGTIAPWVSGSVECTCVIGGVSIYGDFVFKIPAVPLDEETETVPSGPANTLSQSFTSLPYTPNTIQVFGFFYSKQYLGITQPTAHMKVSVLYSEDSIIDVFYLPVNAALTAEYAGNVSGVINFYLAKAEFELREDKNIASIVVTMSNQDDVDLYCDNIAVRLNTNVPVSRSTYNTRAMSDKYGMDTAFMDNFKNMVWNSSFEVFDPVTLVPLYWDTAGVADPNSNFSGSYSLKLATGAIAGQTGSGLITPSWYGSGPTRVSFHSRNSPVTIKIYDVTNDSYFDVTPQDNVGNPNPATVTTSYTTVTHPSWLNSRDSVSFDPTSHPTCTQFNIEFTNAGGVDCWIDDVMLTPDFTGKWPQLYKDGPRSVSASSVIGVDGTPLDEGGGGGGGGTGTVDPPADPGTGDTWLDISDPLNPQWKWWDGDSWEPIPAPLNGGAHAFYVQPDAPASPVDKDLWVDTDSYSRYDMLDVTTNTVLTISGPEFVVIRQPNLTITVPDPTDYVGVELTIKHIYPDGVTLLICPGAITIDNEVERSILTKGYVRLMSDGIQWLVVGEG
jgi:hypothetical protein